MKKQFLFIIFPVVLFLSGCAMKSSQNDLPRQQIMIYDISGTYEEFTKTDFPVTPISGEQDGNVSLTYGTVTPNKELITDVKYDGTNISFVPVTDQGIGTAWVTLTADGNEQTTHIKIYDLSRKLVALDFDDGPSEFTDHILDTLIQTGSSATFYCTGRAYQDVRCVEVGIELYPETFMREVKSGQQIGNHTYNHPWRIMDYERGPSWQTKDWMDYSKSEVREQVKLLDDLVFSMTGFVPEYFAPPYGRDVHLNALKKIIPDRKDNYYDTSDWIMAETTAEDIAQTILSTPTNGTVLMHDVYVTTANGIRMALTSSEAENFQFMTTYELDMIKEQTQ